MAKAKRDGTSKAKVAVRRKTLAMVTSHQILSIKDISIVRFEVRKENVGKDLDELAASI